MNNSLLNATHGCLFFVQTGMYLVQKNSFVSLGGGGGEGDMGGLISGKLMPVGR